MSLRKLSNLIFRFKLMLLYIHPFTRLKGSGEFWSEGLAFQTTFSKDEGLKTNFQSCNRRISVYLGGNMEVLERCETTIFDSKKATPPFSLTEAFFFSYEERFVSIFREIEPQNEKKFFQK